MISRVVGRDAYRRGRTRRLTLQYFGDRRDLDKYDLLLALGQSGHWPGGLAIVPMLTPDDNARHGHLRSRRRDRHPGLRAFLESAEAPSLQGVADFMRQQGVLCQIMTEELLADATRAAYVGTLPTQDLGSRVTFLDPDMGLEVPSRRTTAYLRYSELADIYRRLGTDTVLVVYQHMPHQDHAVFRTILQERLATQAGIRQGGLIEMGDVGFVVTMKSPTSSAVTEDVVARYAQSRSGVSCHFWGADDPASSREGGGGNHGR